MGISPAAQAAQLFAVTYGALTTGAAKTLPTSTSGDIFTVTGGRVIVSGITGVVSTAIQNQACTVSVGHKPTGGSSQVATLATATAVTNAALGTSLGIPAFSGASPGALVVAAPTTLLPAADIGVPIPESGGIALVPAGTVQITTSATNTGAITWSLTWLPYDTGAYVVAA